MTHCVFGWYREYRGCQLVHDFLFVYGTLKQGFVRHTVLQDQSYCCPATTATPCRLFNCGSYPALVACDDGLSIRGELYRVSAECLRCCDEVEGVSTGLYARRRIDLVPVQHAEATIARAWCYFYLLSTDGLPECGAEWTA